MITVCKKKTAFVFYEATLFVVDACQTTTEIGQNNKLYAVDGEGVRWGARLAINYTQHLFKCCFADEITIAVVCDKLFQRNLVLGCWRYLIELCLVCLITWAHIFD